VVTARDGGTWAVVCEQWFVWFYSGELYCNNTLQHTATHCNTLQQNTLVCEEWFL